MRRSLGALLICLVFMFSSLGTQPLFAQENSGQSPTFLPSIRNCNLAKDDIYWERQIAENSIYFSSNSANTFNAGVAATAINNYVIQANEKFSFNQVVGARTTEKGYRMGKDIKENDVIGGGVCRTATLMFQTARKAGLSILERHPHSKPVAYASAGNDATVSWGSLDLVFRNTRAVPVKVTAGITAEKNGRRLWSNMYEITSRTPIEVLVQNQPVNSYSEIPTRLTGFMQDGTTYISIEQMCDLLGVIVELHFSDPHLYAYTTIRGESFRFQASNPIAVMSGQEFTLAKSPLYLPNSSCNFWISLVDVRQLTGMPVQFVSAEGSSFILLDASSWK